MVSWAPLGSSSLRRTRRLLHDLLHVRSVHVHSRFLHLLSDFWRLDAASFCCGTLALQIDKIAHLRDTKIKARLAEKGDELATRNIDCHATHGPMMPAQWRDDSTL